MLKLRVCVGINTKLIYTAKSGDSKVYKIKDTAVI
jgi:serine/threonine protein phosphatase PrpC